jgi:hypothetical protein
VSLTVISVLARQEEAPRTRAWRSGDERVG